MIKVDRLIENENNRKSSFSSHQKNISYTYGAKKSNYPGSEIIALRNITK